MTLPDAEISSGLAAMVLTIGSDVITSDRTVHSARRLPRDFIWREVSYLPGRRMDQEDAVTAMKLADEAGREYSPDLLRTWISLEIRGEQAQLGTGGCHRLPASLPPSLALRGESRSPGRHRVPPAAKSQESRATAKGREGLRRA